MKNEDLYKEMKTALNEVGDFSVFNKRKFLAALLTEDIDPVRIQGIKDAVNLIVSCECLDKSDSDLDFGITQEQNEKLMHIISDALKPEAA